MTKALRTWQVECVEASLNHYRTSPHFFCQATPGAGKTWMAAEVARRLFLADKIDLVLCFAPSCQVVEGFRNTFATILGKRMDGLIGALGDVSTYQGMEYRSSAFWQLLDGYRVFAVFDEIHHCAGHDPLLSNAWGQIIVQKIQDRAAYTLALSGTPWRSDDKAIALARYKTPEGKLICDFQYGLREAVIDNVCRSPRIVLVDNSMLKLTEHGDNDRTVTVYPNIAQLLTESPVTFEEILSHDEIVSQVLELGCRKLDEIRKGNPSAGGLVVATNTVHAHRIASSLTSRGETCRVVTNRTPGAQQLINEFREGQGRWIVAVGMISEGTDIPRLQVCCYLSRIRTELHYRQVLGRVLRRLGDFDDQAWLYVLAEPALQQFSQRIADDIPDDLSLLRTVTAPFVNSATIETEEDARSVQLEGELSLWRLSTSRNCADEMLSIKDWASDCSYEIDVSSHFRTQLLSVL